ncbi:MAG: class II aldolase/adducin family protein [Ramlibacter sp.]|nr:class II aldolase/adducin family protein [Ramlibacter sp.]
MNPTHDETWRARVHLAAANRLAVYDDLEEGIDNHFTMRVPGQDDRYLVLPFGQHWSEARASDLIVFNEAGDVLEGSGGLELSALSIHAPLHRLTGANVIMHTHQTWALSLNMLEDNRLLRGSQTAAFITRNIACDAGYTGLADSLSEGERLATVLGDKQILFMKNHGVLVVGDTVAQAYRRLYKLERVCRAQVLAMSTGRPLALLDEAMVKKVEAPNPRNSHSQAEREALYFAAMMRVLDREMPGYAD